MTGRAVLLLVGSLTGCAVSTGLSRQGKVAGDAPGGGLGTSMLVGAQHRRGPALGVLAVGYAGLSQASATAVEHAGGAVVAGRLSVGGDWAGFAQLFAGRLSGASAGVEWRASPPGSELLSTMSLGVVYTRSEDEAIGAGEFVGVELGVLMGLSTRPRP